MKRRLFLKNLATLSATPALLGPLDFSRISNEIWRFQVSQNGLSILQGITDETSTQLTVDLPVDLSVEFTLLEDSRRRIHHPVQVRTCTRPPSAMRTDKVFFSGLEPGRRYTLLVKDTGANKILDERYLATVDLSKRNARIAVMSCMNDLHINQNPIWQTAQNAAADYYFFLGDAIYGDPLIVHGPDLLWRRFVDGRNTIPFYKWKHLKPVIAVWDDHDFGKNNAGHGYVHKDQNKVTFQSFFAQEPVEGLLQSGPGIARYFRAFHQNFFFFDNRYFRGLNNGFLGHEQIEWASQIMAGASGPVWIMEGSPFYGRSDKGADASYESAAPAEFSALKHEIKKWNQPAIFIGGDVHYSEVSRIERSELDYSTYELISSCMHSSSKSVYYQNPNVHLGGTFKQNFLLLDKQGLAQDPSWNVSCFGEGQSPLFSTQCSIS